MVSTKKLIQMAKKWQRIAVTSTKRISWLRPLTEKGHFVVYTAEGRWFMIPLTYLGTDIFIELLRMAEEEFGVAALPCDSSFMDYAISMIRRHVSKDLEKALIASWARCRYSSLVEHQERNKPTVFDV